MSSEGERPAVSIIGAGRVGTAFGVLLARMGYPVAGVVCRTAEAAHQAVMRIGAGTPMTDPGKGAVGAGIVLVTVPDGAIESVMKQIVGTRSFEPTDLLVHTSGALSADVLRVPGSEPAKCLSLHPIQTIADREKGADRLAGAYFGIEGDESAVEFGFRLVQNMGGYPLRIKPGMKALYHAAACMASNYLVTLIHAGLSLYEQAGLSRKDALAAVLPLLAGTLENAQRVGIPGSLTGPIERADVETIRVHLDALQLQQTKAENPEDVQRLDTLYRVLGRATVEIAREKVLAEQAPRADDVYDKLEEILQALKTESKGVHGNGK